MTASLHAAAVALLNAALQLVAAFGVDLTGSQNIAITGVVNSALVIVSLIVTQPARTRAAA